MRNLLEEYPLYKVEEFNSLQEMLSFSVKKFANKLALEDLNQTPIPKLTYSELYEKVFQFGKALKSLGLEERDHIALISENRVQWGLAYLAAVTFNFVIVPIDKNLKENEILTILHASDSKAAIFSESFREMFLEFRRTLKDLKYLIDMDLEEERDKIFSMMEMIQKEKYDSIKDRFPKIQPDDVSVIVFTSGSMGRAKGVMLSQKNIASNLVDMRTMIELLPEDRFLSVLPIHHTYECTCGLLCPLSAGSSIHYARSLKTIVEDIQKVKATILLGVPLLYEKMYRRITKAIEENKIKKLIIKPLKTLTSLFETIGAKELRKKIFHEIHDRFGGHIRIFIVGGAAPDPQVAKGLRSFGFNFIQGYGLTETSPILALNRLRKFKDEAAGLPLPRVQIRIENPDEEGRGEIVVKGPNVMLGYYKNEEATNKVLKDGWFYTGDFGYIDNDGFLHICGRKKNVIIAKNGKNVFPEELEDQIKRIPFVLESVVYGYKNNSGDEEIGVMIVPNAEVFIEYSQKEKNEVSPQMIEKIINEEIRKLNKELPIYKQIRTVKIQEGEFEKTTTQKIKRYLINQEDSVH